MFSLTQNSTSWSTNIQKAEYLEYTDHRKLESGPMNGKKLDTREIVTIAAIGSSGISGVKMKDSS